MILDLLILCSTFISLFFWYRKSSLQSLVLAGSAKISFVTSMLYKYGPFIYVPADRSPGSPTVSKLRKYNRYLVLSVIISILLLIVSAEFFM